VADGHPSIEKLMRAAAEALRGRPLPSACNSDEDALRRLTISSVTIEMAFQKLQTHAASQEAFDAGMGVAVSMREIGKDTISRPELRPLTAAAIQAISAKKAEIVKEMDEKVLGLHVAEVKGPSAPAPAVKKAAPKGPTA
jgi:hypothetical protein